MLQLDEDVQLDEESDSSQEKRKKSSKKKHKKKRKHHKKGKGAKKGDDGDVTVEGTYPKAHGPEESGETTEAASQDNGTTVHIEAQKKGKHGHKSKKNKK